MGRRLILLIVAVTCAIGLLTLMCTSHKSRVPSTVNDARVVYIQSGDDVNKRMGIPQVSHTSDRSSSKSLRKETVIKQLTEQQLLEIYVKNIKDILAFEEGLRLTPYLCSEGYVTIGYGTVLYAKKGLNPSDFPLRITAETAGQWLEKDVEKVVTRLRTGSKANIFNRMNIERQTILISMAYQMGYYGLIGFPKMWAALDAGDWFEASEQAKDSLWYRQTPQRASRHARVLETGSMTVYDYAIDGVPYED